ncbi:MAG: DUF1801 domain-containing protein [Hyphomicrobiales bacterium]
MSDMPIIPTNVSPAFQLFPPEHRDTLLEMRELIFEVARTDPRIGVVLEELRWGEPAYITANKKTGSTIRLGIEKASGLPALFFICSTSLVEDFRIQFGELLTYSKNRAVLIDRNDSQHKSALGMCIASALTYHLRKN